MATQIGSLRWTMLQSVLRSVPMGIAARRAAGKVRSISCSLRVQKAAAAALPEDYDGAPSAVRSDCVVNSHNEWDTLEEVIVGSVKGATTN